MPIATSSATRTTCWPSSASDARITGCSTSSTAIPGMKVADLLDILKITKQSLGRVLKQLVDEGFIVQKEGAEDRRQRLLYVTPKGAALALSSPLADRAHRARARRARANAHEAARRFLLAMIDATPATSVPKLIAPRRSRAATANADRGRAMTLPVRFARRRCPASPGRR